MAESIDINPTSLAVELERAKTSCVEDADLQVAAPTVQPGCDLEESPSFIGIMKRYLGEFNTLQHDADSQIQKLVSGETQDLHEVTVAMDEAQTSFELMMEIRKRLADAYQEVMRMQ